MVVASAMTNSTVLLPGRRTLKFAVTLLFPFIVMVFGFTDPVRSPLQEPNVYPVLGVAVTVTAVPAL